MVALKVTLAQRHIKQARHEQRIQTTLQSAKKRFAAVRAEKRRKIKTVPELMASLSISKSVLCGRTLRDATAYTPRSHNFERQLIGLIDHLFVRYPVPLFLYSAFRDDPTDPFNCNRDLYQEWFVTLAQGESFPKAVKGVMTSREAACFLQAPWYGRIQENVWWAKLTGAGIPVGLRTRLIAKVFGRYRLDDSTGRLKETIHFFASHGASIEARKFDEVCDFIDWMLRNDPSFRMRGRTASSAIRLSDEWHKLIRRVKPCNFVEWAGLSLGSWQNETSSAVYDIVELRDNRELMLEGRKQRHCVYSYVSSCESNASAIFSLRVFSAAFVGEYDVYMRPRYRRLDERSRVTIEVYQSRREVAQIKGPLNRPPTDEEKSAVKQWAAEKGLTIRSWCLRD